MISRRRLTVLSLAAASVFAGACAASNANEAEPPPSPTIGGVGVPPPQLGAAEGQSQPQIATASSYVLDAGNAPQIDDNRVFMVGDSVMKAMTLGNPDALDYSVGALGWDVTVDAVVGRFTDQGLRVLEKRPDEIHQVVVLMLGNNYNGDEQDFRNLISDIRDTLSDTRKIVMFTVPEYEPKQKEVNDVLRQAAAEDPRFVLVDWETITRTVRGVLSGDDIHPTEYGAQVLAQLIGNALGKAPGAGPDVTLPIVGSTEHGPLPDGVQRNHDEPSGTTGTTRRTTRTTSARRNGGGSGNSSGGGSSAGSGTTAAPATDPPPADTQPPQVGPPATDPPQEVAPPSSGG
jgi:hypothetical protein